MPPGPSESGAIDSDSADAFASAEAAEEAAAAAEARAEATRARADELRRKLEAARASSQGDPIPEKASRVRQPRLKTVAGALAGLLIAGFLGGTGYIVWQHRKVAEERHHVAEFSAAARQSVVNLMSMDYKAADETVQRVIDDSTGKFKANFEDTSDDLIKAMRDSKVVTKVMINDAAVESMTPNSAVVIVTATSQREDPQAPKGDKQARLWRVVVSLEKADGRIKMSNVEFV
jgi:Mce-associated membrane protein